MGVKTWSVTPEVEKRPRVFKNTVMKKISGPTRGTIIEEWRRLHEGIHGLYSLNKYYVGD